MDKTSIHIELAGKTIKLNSRYQLTDKMLRPFYTTKTFSDISLELDANEMIVYHVDDETKARINVSNMLRRITDALIELDVLLIHASSIAIDNGAYLFSATSGTGKSTHVRKWLEHFSDAFVINGDKPFILFPDDGSCPLACGSPWAGKENMYTNTKVPINAIICMEQSDNNLIYEISFAEAFPFLLQQVYRPDDEKKMKKTLRLLQSLNGMVKFYKFYCNNFKDDCFDVVYNALFNN